MVNSNIYYISIIKVKRYDFSPLTNINTKMTAAEFIQLFLCVHGLLHTASDLDQAELGVKSMNATLTALVATQSFTTEKLLEITIINLYTLKHIMENGASKLQDLTEDEAIVRELVLDLLAGSISAFLIPVHTLKLDESLLDYYALPAGKTFHFCVGISVSYHFCTFKYD